MSVPASLDRDGEGRYRVNGPMTVATVPALWPVLERAVRDTADFDLSLGGVTQADSAAVACLVACSRAARGRVRFTDMPESMRVIVEVSDLGDLFESRAGSA
ncbi:hypothetical protein BI364_14670 [Acidihalobacter yilgarnensis]|uniref:STAS domain-containing protein n=1 Tax=Acidihalobacter yilgarnensis TaxID=2819280 RepID=A0A1D8IRJ6_9GAMM|nr:STAS domain-containing protein [Acidihalobacter yilgarnensis]AOU99023.1 hypothetical protein BI364_14670 [Acidihalobacter yilgarnensis]